MSNLIKITKQSGIPVIGTMYFGIMDRNTNIIELRPTTLCNLNCIFCSVGAGPKSSYENDFVVDESYLADELRKVLEYKAEKMDIWLNPQGDPTMYPGLVKLVSAIRKLKYAGNIVMITNGMLLTEKKVDELRNAGLTQINLSMNAFSREKAKVLAGHPSYDSEKVKSMARYIAKRLKLELTPVYMKNINEDDIDSIIEFSRETGAGISLQNFLRNRRGRNPSSSLAWKKFSKRLEELEKKHGIRLINESPLKKTRPLPKAAKKGQVIESDICLQSKFIDEKIAVYNGRCIVVFGAMHMGKARIKVIKSSNNLYYGRVI